MINTHFKMKIFSADPVRHERGYENSNISGFPVLIGVRNISVIFATSCRFLFGNVTKGKSQFVMTVVPSRDLNLNLCRWIRVSPPLVRVREGGRTSFLERLTLSLACGLLVVLVSEIAQEHRSRIRSKDSNTTEAIELDP